MLSYQKELPFARSIWPIQVAVKVRHSLENSNPNVLWNKVAAVTGRSLSFFARGSSLTTLPVSPSLSINQDRAATTSQQQKQLSQHKDLSGLTVGSGKYLVSVTCK
jgi:hypothetical protein